MRRGNLEVIDFFKTEIASLRSQRRQKYFFSDLLISLARYLFPFPLDGIIRLKARRARASGVILPPSRGTCIST